jgi:hypothetical protein
MSKTNQTRYPMPAYLVGNYLLEPLIITHISTGYVRVWKRVPSKPPEEQVSKLDKPLYGPSVHINRLHCHPYQNQIAFQVSEETSWVTIFDFEKDIETTFKICANIHLLSFYGECIQSNMSLI